MDILHTYISFDELQSAWENAGKHNTVPDPVKFPRHREGEWIDEEKSVTWNKAEIAREQAAYSAERQRLREINNAEIQDAEEKTIYYIMQETGVSEKSAQAVFSYLYCKYHHCTGDLVNCMDEVLDLVQVIKNYG